MDDTGRMDDTIAAIATAPGRAGLALVRVSGPGTEEVARAVGLTGLEPRRATLCRLRHPESGRILDRAVATRYVAPASYTGEDMLEIGCHGGSLVPQLVLDALLAAGAGQAAPGEFSRRAFLNGKLDLLQVEATVDLVDARSAALHRAALFQLEGGLSRRIDRVRERLLRLLAMLAYEIDFPEEDEGPVPPERIEEAAAEARTEIEGLLRNAPEGELLRDGALAVIAGRPNAGKSSIFNSLLGEKRAIVTDLPGTTRDAIEALLSVEGYPFRLVDTAGLREEPDPVEGLGIEVAEGYLARADVVLFCAEAGRTLGPDEEAFLARWEAQGRAVIRVRTKADLLPARVEAGLRGGDGEAGAGIRVSAVEAEGLDRLRRALLDAVYAGIRGAEEAPLLTRRRQVRAMRRSLAELDAFRDAWEGGLPAEIAATHLQDAVRALEELLGAVDHEDVLDLLFSSFCVGK